MPYSKNSQLPAQTKYLPERAKTIWREAFNQVYRPGAQSESFFFAHAWNKVKNKYTKSGHGKMWVPRKRSGRGEKSSSSSWHLDFRALRDPMNWQITRMIESPEERTDQSWSNTETRPGPEVLVLDRLRDLQKVRSKKLRLRRVASPSKRVLRWRFISDDPENPLIMELFFYPDQAPEGAWLLAIDTPEMAWMNLIIRNHNFHLSSHNNISTQKTVNDLSLAQQRRLSRWRQNLINRQFRHPSFRTLMILFYF